MDDVLDAFDFLLDLVCVRPPSNITDMAGLSPGVLMAGCLGSVFLLFILVTASSMREAFAGKAVPAAVAAVCIGLISFISMERTVLEGIIVVAYTAMVISIRGVEGLILGSKYRPKARAWHPAAFIGTGAALYVALRQFPSPPMHIAEGAWAVIGALIASCGWTGKISQPGNSTFNSPFSKVALFLVFISTMLYVQSSRTDYFLFQWVFPVGFIGGLVAGRKAS